MLKTAFAVIICSIIQFTVASIFLGKYGNARQGSPRDSSAPEWPPYFVSNWTMFATPVDDPPPPYRYNPPAPFRAGRGQTYYDWTTSNIIEIYQDFCIPLFDLPEKINWTCHFLNANNTAYLITTQNELFPPCCVFGQPWQPPAPDFAKNLEYNQTLELCEGNQTIDFYLRTLWDNGQEYNPFGYGFSRDWTTNGTNSWRKGARFYFLAYEGWVSQFFNTFDAQKPDPIVFQIPAECNNAPYCYFLQEPPNTTTTATTTTSTSTTTATTTTTTSNAAFNLKTAIIPFAILLILFTILA